MDSPAIKTTGDGSQTLIHPVHGDSYHSMRGAVGESTHVFIEAGFLHNNKEPLTILEVGFGSGLNALLTAREAEKQTRRTEYHALELYPVDEAVIERLEYATDPLFIGLHRAKWGEMEKISPYFFIKKLQVSLPDWEPDINFDLVYFDAFAPDTQPEMWSESVFRKLRENMNQGAELVTYSSKGTVKRALRAAGLEVERLPGALGKRHMLRARKA